MLIERYDHFVVYSWSTQPSYPTITSAHTPHLAPPVVEGCQVVEKKAATCGSGNEKKKKAAAFRDQKSGRSRQDDIAKAQAEAAQNIQAHGDLGYHA